MARRAGWLCRAALLGLALTLAAPAVSPTWAQIPLTAAKADPNDPDSVLVEELVVIGRLPGPAWWTVSNGTTTVYVLGAPSLAPKRMTWDRGVFDRHLAGASMVILPFQDVHVTVLGSFGAAFNYLRLRGGGPFEATLDPVARARFAAVRTRLGLPADRAARRRTRWPPPDPAAHRLPQRRPEPHDVRPHKLIGAAGRFPRQGPGRGMAL